MVGIICGEKGKGKTKELLDRANTAVTSASGSIVYLDKSTKHMYELSNKVRLINVTDYKIESCDEFVGFLSGIVSQDNDLEEVYLDSFLTIASIKDDEELLKSINKIDIIGNKYNIKFVLNISKDLNKLPDDVKSKVVVSL
ncbi:MAG: twitching motility protein PilT [Agathobacter sp.]|nr:twitching motility protein PilT [Agathobacter sp.]